MRIALFISGEIADAAALRALASSCDEIWAVDGGLDRLLALGLRPNLFLGDGDSLSPTGSQWLKNEAIPQKRYPEAKDETDSELALRLAAERIAEAIAPSPHIDLSSPEAASLFDSAQCILLDHPGEASSSSPTLFSEAAGVPSGWPAAANGILLAAPFGYRLDHVLANFDLAARYVRPDLPLLFSDGQRQIWTIEGPFSLRFPLRDLPVKSPAESNAGKIYLSLLPVDPEVREVWLHGVRWPLEAATLQRGSSLGISNESDGISPEVTLELSSGRLRVSLMAESKAAVREAQDLQLRTASSSRHRRR